MRNSPTISLTSIDGTWEYHKADNAKHSLAIGDRVLLQDDLRCAWVLVDRFTTPEGHHRVVIEPEHAPPSTAPIQMLTCASKLIAAPEDWEDAPERYEDALVWNLKHRQPLLAKLRQGLMA